MDILFEDEFIICVDKPAMVLSQPSFDKNRIPVKEQLEYQRPDLKNKLFLHHRLDFETSGVFLMSKSPISNKPLTEMFKNHNFEKFYVCLTRPNALSAGKKVTCEINSENENTWTIKNFMAPAKGMGGGKRRMISVKAGGWQAETEFKILSTNLLFHYIQAKPKTGRTHQIRQHLQESYRSILGDNIYGGKSADVPRLMLHAHRLEFQHPITHQPLKIEAALPKDFESCLHKV
jgi:23S rRNA pseudouridine955/2504/2580 synthase